MKKIFLAILLFVAFNASAQTKYDYAVITIFPQAKELQIAMTGKEFKTVPIDKEQIKGNGDVTLALQEIDKMQENGWELMEADGAGAITIQYKIYTFFLRRKKA